MGLSGVFAPFDLVAPLSACFSVGVYSPGLKSQQIIYKAVEVFVRRFPSPRWAACQGYRAPPTRDLKSELPSPRWAALPG